MQLMTFGIKQFSFSAAVTLQVILLIGGLAIANLFAQRMEYEWDMSEGKIHSLSAQTQSVLDAVDQPIRILVFAATHSEVAERLLKRFDRGSRQVSYEMVFTNEDPGLAKEYEIEADGVVVVECGEARRRLPRLTEQTLTTAILQLTRGEERKVLFTAGRGEKDTQDTNPAGYDKARRLLTQAGYTVVQEAITEASLAGAATVVIAGPTTEFDIRTNTLLQQYVEAGGGLMVMVDPHPGVGLVELLKPYRIEPQDDFIVELNKAFRHRSYGATTSYIRAFHSKQPVGKRMHQPILLGFVRSIGIRKNESATDDESEDTQSPIALCVSSPNSWGETDRDLDKKITWSRELDPPGPRVMAAGTPDPPSVAGKGRVMVIGTSGFADNRHIDVAGNREFFETTVSWLADDLDSPLLEVTEVQRKLDLTDAQLQQMLAVCVLVIPAMAAVMGLFVFIRRAQ